MKIDPYYQRQKCRTMTLVFGGIRIVRMFAVVPRGGGVKRQWGCQRQFFCVFYCYFSDTLEMRPVLLHGDMQSVVVLSAVQIFGRDSSFWQYKIYASILSGSLETRHQTTVGSRVMRTCCGRMLKFIRCVRNKFAGRRFRR